MFTFKLAAEVAGAKEGESERGGHRFTRDKQISAILNEFKLLGSWVFENKWTLQRLKNWLNPLRQQRPSRKRTM